MEIQRLPSTPISALERKTPSDPPPPPQPDSFQPGDKPPMKKILAATSVTATVGMFIGVKVAAANPALGFVLGAAIGGAVGFGLSKFAYAQP